MNTSTQIIYIKLRILRSILTAGLILFMQTQEAYAQSGVAIGKWKSYLPLQQGKFVTQSANKIIYGSPWGIISIDKEDLSGEFISKVEGLSDIGIQGIKYDPFNQQLIIVYTNSNIDVLRNGKLINIPNIKENNSISGEKTLYDVFVHDANNIFISSSFGVIAIDGAKLEFKNSLFTGGIRVRDFTIFNGTKYIATEDGLYTLPANENFSDFGRWILAGANVGLAPVYAADQIEVFDTQLYLAIDNVVYRFDSQAQKFVKFYAESQAGYSNQFLRASQNHLIAGFYNQSFQSQVLFFDKSGQIIRQGGQCSNIVLDAIVDEKKRVWYADGFGDIRYATDLSTPCKRLNYDSPYSHLVSDLAIKNELVLAASGGVSESFLYLFGREGFYFLNKNRWQNFNENLNSVIKNFELLSVYRVLFHPNEDKLYAGSYWAGLLEYDFGKDQYTLFNKTNSTLRGAIGDETRERITGMVFDNNDNLWISTYGAAKPLNVLTKDGKWASFNVNAPNALIDISMDQNGVLWIPVFGNNGGVLIYDPGKDPLNSSDDRQRFITESNSALTSNLINDIITDRDGTVWVGTAEGPVIFDCGSRALESSCTGVRRKVLQDSIAAFLLADQDVRVIAFDGANQKWFGTRNGLFVQSPDGINQIAHFNTTNSPLFDDQIQALSYNGKSGEMFIGTNKGIMSYRTNSSEAEPIHRKDKVLVFPNPVPPDYQDLIAIKGLVEDANVKITDINGRLVREIQSFGGTATWDGKDSEGKPSTSGVYLVFSSSTDPFTNPDSFVTKIMLLRN